MKTRVILYFIIITGIIGFSGCGGENSTLKKDARNIADVMCKSIEAMKNLKIADPSDTLLIKKLQAEYKVVESEMSTIYKEFQKKYGDKTTTKEFSVDFRKYLNEAMLDCKSLSKEDRETFEKGTK